MPKELDCKVLRHKYQLWMLAGEQVIKMLACFQMWVQTLRVVTRMTKILLMMNIWRDEIGIRIMYHLGQTSCLVPQ